MNNRLGATAATAVGTAGLIYLQSWDRFSVWCSAVAIPLGVLTAWMLRPAQIQTTVGRLATAW